MNSQEIANSMWAFEDSSRRCAQKLFEWTADPKLSERRMQYRVALLNVMQGLEREDPFFVAAGFHLIGTQFQTLQSWKDYQDDRKGVEVQPDVPLPPRAFDVT